MRRVFSVIAAIALALAAAQSGAAGTTRELRPFDANSMNAIRQAHAGRPFVLAFWSINCEPCREEMAEWKSLRSKHPGIPVLLVSTDAPADRATAVAFLSRYDPGPVQTWIFADEFAERVRYAVDRTWRGELPRTYLYDAAHRPEGRSGRLDRNWIESWLARQGAASRPRQP